ncbi:MAG: flavin oxidoreductase/NADH oxidase [Kiritimatiellae bacterium]|nr:flavin oxidoreductase/NADH oxidase [Kiritimatiellia bacterium]
MTRHAKFSLKTLDDLRRELASRGLDLPLSADASILAQPLALGAAQLHNRFAVQPMEGLDADADGTPGKLAFRRYGRYAAGGASLIWAEATAVVPEGRANPRQFWLHDGNVDAFRRLAEATRRSARETGWPAPLLVLQLTHSGRYSKPDGRARPKIAHHSPVLDPVHALPDDYPLVTDGELDRLQENFVHSASLAAQAGFDGVDIKCCHRYLLSELLASYTREGRYGGSFENRTRMLRETIARVKAQVPGVIVVTRVNLFDGIAHPYGFATDPRQPGRPALDEAVMLIGMLVDLEVPLINVTIGNPYFNPHVNRPFDRPATGAALPEEHPLEGIARFAAITVAAQRAAGKTPVVASGLGWLRHLAPHAAAGLINAGGAMLWGQGRNAFAYPDAPADFMRSGRFDPARCCVTCSACTQLMREGRCAGCAVRDREFYGTRTGAE